MGGATGAGDGSGWEHATPTVMISAITLVVRYRRMPYSVFLILAYCLKRLGLSAPTGLSDVFSPPLN